MRKQRSNVTFEDYVTLKLEDFSLRNKKFMQHYEAKALLTNLWHDIVKRAADSVGLRTAQSFHHQIFSALTFTKRSSHVSHSSFMFSKQRFRSYWNYHTLITSATSVESNGRRQRGMLPNVVKSAVGPYSVIYHAVRHGKLLSYGRTTEASIYIFIAAGKAMTNCDNSRFAQIHLFILSFIRKCNLHHMFSSIKAIKEELLLEINKRLSEANISRVARLRTQKRNVRRCFLSSWKSVGTLREEEENLREGKKSENKKNDSRNQMNRSIVYGRAFRNQFRDMGNWREILVVVDNQMKLSRCK